jgi:hypothetical protein
MLIPLPVLVAVIINLDERATRLTADKAPDRLTRLSVFRMINQWHKIKAELNSSALTFGLYFNYIIPRGL